MQEYLLLFRSFEWLKVGSHIVDFFSQFLHSIATNNFKNYTQAPCACVFKQSENLSMLSYENSLCLPKDCPNQQWLLWSSLSMHHQTLFTISPLRNGTRSSQMAHNLVWSTQATTIWELALECLAACSGWSGLPCPELMPVTTGTVRRSRS